MTRRDLLRSLGFVGAASALAGPAAKWAMTARGAHDLVSLAAATAPTGSDIGAIDHIVFLMMENRSYDHYFGAYPKGRGFDDHPVNSLGVFAQDYPGGTSLNPPGVLLPFHLLQSAGEECTDDLTHDWGPQHLCWGNGKMDAFAATHTSSSYEGCTWPTMQEMLQDAGVSWKVYSPSNANLAPQYAELASFPTWDPALYNPIANPEIMVATDHVLPYFSAFRNPASALCASAFTPTFPGSFAADVASGGLPSVSWIIPPLGFDDHPAQRQLQHRLPGHRARRRGPGRPHRPDHADPAGDHGPGHPIRHVGCLPPVGGE